jgi:hypothetical protein
LVSVIESQAREEGGGSRGTGGGVHVGETGVYLSQAIRGFSTGILETLVVTLGVESRKTSIKTSLLLQEMMTPDVGTKDRLQRGGVITNNLSKQRSVIFRTDIACTLPLARRREWRYGREWEPHAWRCVEARSIYPHHYVQ